MSAEELSPRLRHRKEYAQCFAMFAYIDTLYDDKLAEAMLNYHKSVTWAKDGVPTPKEIVELVQAGQGALRRAYPALTNEQLTELYLLMCGERIFITMPESQKTNPDVRETMEKIHDTRRQVSKLSEVYHTFIIRAEHGKARLEKVEAELKTLWDKKDALTEKNKQALAGLDTEKVKMMDDNERKYHGLTDEEIRELIDCNASITTNTSVYRSITESVEENEDSWKETRRIVTNLYEFVTHIETGVNRLVAMNDAVNVAETLSNLGESSLSFDVKGVRRKADESAAYLEGIKEVREGQSSEDALLAEVEAEEFSEKLRERIMGK